MVVEVRRDVLINFQSIILPFGLRRESLLMWLEGCLNFMYKSRRGSCYNEISRSGMGLIFAISNKLTDDADTRYVGHTFSSKALGEKGFHFCLLIT